MKTRYIKPRKTGWILLIAGLALLAGLASPPPAFATSGYLSTWSSLYPGSASDNNAGCQLCHGSSTQNINPYGFALAQCNGASGSITQRIQAAEGLNSDGDTAKPGGFTNLEETNASTQPGWTTGAMQVWTRNGCAPAGTNTYPGSGNVDPTPAPEICDNGVDDNNNGLIDCQEPSCNGFVDGATSCGVGACASTGNLVCQTPGQIDNCTPGTPTTEGPFGDPSCSDGIDNDCDGSTDAADPSCAAPQETCDNNIDDNGNGLIDCADPQCNGFVYGPDQLWCGRLLGQRPVCLPDAGHRRHLPGRHPGRRRAVW